MKRTLIVTFGLLCLGFTAVSAQDELAQVDGSRAHTYKSSLGRPLTAASKADATSIVGKYLTSHGADAATLASLRTVEQRSGRVPGLTHIRMEQQVGGLRVVDAYVKASINARGELVHLIENLAQVKGAVLTSPKTTEPQALVAALAALYPDFKSKLAVISRQGNTTMFDKGNFFYSSPSVERVAFVTKSG